MIDRQFVTDIIICHYISEAANTLSIFFAMLGLFFQCHLSILGLCLWTPEPYWTWLPILKGHRQEGPVYYLPLSLGYRPGSQLWALLSLMVLPCQRYFLLWAPTWCQIFSCFIWNGPNYGWHPPSIIHPYPLRNAQKKNPTKISIDVLLKYLA